MRPTAPLLAALAVVLAGAPSAAADTVARPDLLHHFADAGTDGTMVVQRSGSRPRTWVVGAARSERPYVPSSTFKVPNAVLALDRGVVSGPGQVFAGPHPNVELDGAPLLPAVCEGDVTFGVALASSCIPIFQHIARAIGLRDYERELRRLHYGNRRVGDVVDRFWLDGPLAISARDQVRFLRRLARGTLPVSRRAQQQVGDLLVLERDGATVLRGKTGYVFTTAPRIGWWVGWVQRGATTWVFALNLDVTRSEHLAARTRIGRAVLAELGALR